MFVLLCSAQNLGISHSVWNGSVRVREKPSSKRIASCSTCMTLDAACFFCVGYFWGGHGGFKWGWAHFFGGVPPYSYTCSLSLSPFRRPFAAGCQSRSTGASRWCSRREDLNPVAVRGREVWKGAVRELGSQIGTLEPGRELQVL